MTDRKNSVPGDSAYSAFIRALESHRMLAPGDRVMLSLSAGKDSMALLDMMARCRDGLSLTLAAFHLNHMVRGGESEADGEFLARICGDRGVSLVVERFDFNAHTPAGRSFEEFAREQRYRMLRRAAADFGAVKIATAHTRDDLVETVLMRVFRGTGVHGLEGIAPVSGDLIRPMLELGSADAYAYLRTRSIGWREDASNADTACDRNYVRNVLLPAIESRFPDCRDAIVRLSFNAADSGSLLDRLLGDTYGELCLTEGESVIVPLDRTGGDDSVMRHALMSALRGIGVFPKSSMLAEALRRLRLTRKSHVELYAGQGIAIRKTLRVGRPVIEIGKGTARQNRVREWSVRLTRSELERGAVASLEEAGLIVRARFLDDIPGREELTSSDRIFVDIKGEIDYIVIRGRMPGDRMALDGATRKIKEMFIDKKLDPYDKHRVPVLVAGSVIAATMEGFVTGRSNTVADGFRIGKLPEKILAIQKVCE